MKTNSYPFYKFCLPVYFVLLFNSSIYAQQESPQGDEPQVTFSDDSYPRFTWDVSTDLQFLLRTSTQGDVLVRKNKIKRLKNWSKRYTAFRYRLQLLHHETDVNDKDGMFSKDDMDPGQYSHLYSKHRSLQRTELGLSVGYEWQEYFGRFMLHYGSDLGFRRSIEEFEYAHYFGNTSNPEDKKIYKDADYSKTSTASIYLAPLLGVRYFVHPMISLTAETQLNIGRSTTDNIQNTGKLNLFWSGEYGNSRDKSTFLTYTPVSMIGVTFHLGKIVR